MCGILGLIAGQESDYNANLFNITARSLYKLSESRGKESSGVAVLDTNRIHIYKQPISASSFIRTKQFKKIIRDVVGRNKKITSTTGLIGHSRLVTNGSQERRDNNQPVVKDSLVGIHNGIIVNDRELWRKFPTLKRKYDVDTEVFLSLFRMNINGSNSIINAAREAFRAIQGTASVAVLFSDIDSLLLATNNGSLYTYENTASLCKIFASEKYILDQLGVKRNLRSILGNYKITQISPGFGEVIDLKTLNTIKFSLKSRSEYPVMINNKTRTILDHSPPDILPLVRKPQIQDNIALLFKGKGGIENLRRCTRCILPETFPFIEFDASGICNYCRSNERIQLKGEKALKRIVDRYRSENGKPDCLVMISGGRDSSYALHYMKTVLNMNPVAYTYDWGMVTDLARRNIARICGKLEIEHILLSADIKKKRSNIYRNVYAWLKKPDLGTIPLFMAGDKQYFFYANKLREQMGIELIVLSANQFERTHFKTGFCGVPPNLGKSKDISNRRGQLQLSVYYAKRFMQNPFYLNSTMPDTLFGFFSYYQIPHSYLRLFDYIPWNEEEIMSILINEYDWEVAGDTKATWRIGDGTASFYNYIYYTLAGFTENDTFRSNQIREGLITREEALARIKDENKPRYEGIKWYLNTIGLGTSLNEVIHSINTAPKLYRRNHG